MNIGSKKSERLKIPAIYIIDGQMRIHLPYYCLKVWILKKAVI